MKKTTVSRLSHSRTGSRGPLESWHGGGDTEIYFYARSLQNTAKALVAKLELDRNARNDWEACPIVLLYRKSLEIQMKSLAGEGGHFLKTRIDPISLSRTHSLRWLAQLVCQIIRTVGCEREFTCDGVSSLADFGALVNEVESFDPVARAIRPSRTEGPDTLSQYYRTFDIGRFARKLDGLLDLLNVTADALAATWEQREAAMAARAKPDSRDDFEPTIQ